MRSCSSTIRRRVRAFGAAIGAGEEVVFVTGLDRPEGALDGIDQFKHVGTPKTLGRLRVGRRLVELSGKQHDTETPTHPPRNSWRPAAWLGLQEPAAAAPSGWKACASGAPSRPNTMPYSGATSLTHPPSVKIRVGFDADLADRGLRPECGVTRHRDALRLGHLAEARRQYPRARLYPREVGDGGVTYFALGHCHNPTIRAASSATPRHHNAHFSKPAVFDLDGADDQHLP